MKTLRILAVGDPAVYGYVKEEYQIIERYEKRNDITIEFEIVEWEQYYNELISSFMKYKYDIVMIAGHLWLTDFVNKGYLSEIKVSDDLDYDYTDILSTIRDEMTLDNKQYLLPSFCDGHMLCYRKDQVDCTDNSPISITDIISRVNIGETCLKAHPSELFLDILPYLRAYGISPFGKEGKCEFNDEDMIKALRHYKNMVTMSVPNTTSFGNAEVLHHIQKGLVKCAVSWGGQIGQILNEDCVNPETLGFVGLQESWNVTWSFAIPKRTKRQKEALQFMKYLSSKEVDPIIGAFCGNPTRRSTFEQDKHKYPWYPNLLDMIQQAKPLPNLGNTGNLIGIYTEEIASYLKQEQSEQETIDNIRNKITSKE